ncbi:MAG: TetR/AcrR family transcriptional regulator [Chloroflexi bacterium]|nr:TetR/AcrR family transcriptional regulator [Chloroflexota bacterium]
MDADKSYKLKIKSRREFKTKILETAAELIRERGYVNVTLDQIAEKLHISKVSIYHHWTSKKEIIFDLHRVAYKVVIESLEKIVGDDDTADSKFRRAIENHVSQVVITGIGPMLPQQDWLVISRHKKEIVKLRDTYEEMLCQIVDEGIKQGVFKHVDVKLLVYTVVGASNYTWVWYSPKGAMTPKEIAAHMSGFILNGIMAKSTAGKKK